MEQLHVGRQDFTDTDTEHTQTIGFKRLSNERKSYPLPVQFVSRCIQTHVKNLKKTSFRALEGGRRRGRQRKCWMNNVKEWTSVPLPELPTMAPWIVPNVLMTHSVKRTELNWPWRNEWKLSSRGYILFLTFLSRFGTCYAPCSLHDTCILVRGFRQKKMDELLIRKIVPSLHFCHQNLSKSELTLCSNLSSLFVQIWAHSLSKSELTLCPNLSSLVCPNLSSLFVQLWVHSLSKSEFTLCSNLSSLFVQIWAHSLFKSEFTLSSNLSSLCPNLSSLFVQISAHSLSKSELTLCPNLSSLFVQIWAHSRAIVKQEVCTVTTFPYIGTLHLLVAESSRCEPV